MSIYAPEKKYKFIPILWTNGLKNYLKVGAPLEVKGKYRTFA